MKRGRIEVLSTESEVILVYTAEMPESRPAAGLGGRRSTRKDAAVFSFTGGYVQSEMALSGLDGDGRFSGRLFGETIRGPGDSAKRKDHRRVADDPGDNPTTACPRCHCSGHPLYNGWCEDCWVNRQSPTNESCGLFDGELERLDSIRRQIFGDAALADADEQAGDETLPADRHRKKYARTQEDGYA